MSLAQYIPTAREIALPLRHKAARDHTCKLRLKDIAGDPFCPSVYFIRKVYPNPMDALRAAGLFPTYPDDADLIRSLWVFQMEEQRVPRWMDAKLSMLLYDYDTYKMRLGEDKSWIRVLVAAGLTEGESNKSWREAITEALVREMINLYFDIGYLPTPAQHDKTHPLHDSRYIMQYIDWETLSERTQLPSARKRRALQTVQTAQKSAQTALVS